MIVRTRIVIAALLLAGCGDSRETPVRRTPSPVATVNGPLPLPVRTVRADLAGRLGVPVGEVRVIRVQAREWPNGCLGLPAPELCSPGPVKGFAVALLAQGRIFDYRTDDRSAFRRAGDRSP